MTADYWLGIVAVLLFWVFSFFVTRKPWPWVLAESENDVGPKRLSASKFQALVWTYVTLFAYGSIFGTRLQGMTSEAPFAELPQIPRNFLFLMGLSAITVTGAKGVTISYKSQGRISDISGGLLTGPEGQGDLLKTQMLVWTIVAASMYIIKLVRGLNDGSIYDMPNIDQTLLVLMGISQGSYLGNKLVTRNVIKTPKITEILPLSGDAGTEVVILGENFGETQGNSFVALNGIPIKTQADGLVAWADLQIRLKIPTTFQVNDTVKIRVHRDGEWSPGEYTFQVVSKK